MAHETDAPMSTLVRGALDDVRDLFREEIALARAELRQEVTKATSAGALLGSAAGAGWFAALFILGAIAMGISELFGWPYWASFGAIGVLLAIAGGLLYAGGRRALSEMRGMPRTIETVKENFR
jgi:peptidoglycan/LPS O-acetylase OafA/YrhL